MENKTADLLLEKAFIQKEKIVQWADLGCGKGFFTEALARQLSPGSKIYAVDKSDGLLLDSLPEIQIAFQKANFEKEHLDLKNLDGILMANSFHFVEDKKKLLKKLSQYLMPDAEFILIEYDTDKANPWVPYPISFLNLKKLFIELGFFSVEKMADTQSLYSSGRIYSALVKKS
ncbi:methyltransferase type 11 [Sphingobacteriaceae bacterium]|nr:methyltransferase type 11 [Sphingobacteriaceae bacterium]